MLSLSPVLVVGVVGEWLSRAMCCCRLSKAVVCSNPLNGCPADSQTDTIRSRFRSMKSSGYMSQTDLNPLDGGQTEVERRITGELRWWEWNGSWTNTCTWINPSTDCQTDVGRIHRVLAFPGIRWRWSTDIKRMFDGLLGFRIFCSTNKHQVRDILRQKLLSLTNFQKYTK